MPTRFISGITGASKERIYELLDQFRVKFGKEAIPAIMWISSDMNNGIIDSQPAIGFYDDVNDIKQDDLLVIDGLRIAVAVSEEDEARFLSKTLDYRDGRFLIC
jgi:hypothetical protein